MRYFGIVGISLAIAALIVGLRAAYYWLKASNVKIDPGWNDGTPKNALTPIEPADLEGMGSLSGWVTATMEAVAFSSELNKKAALWTAAAVVLSGLASVVGSLAVASVVATTNPGLLWWRERQLPLVVGLDRYIVAEDGAKIVVLACFVGHGDHPPSRGIRGEF